MHEVLEATQDLGWNLAHEGYNVLSESALESRLAFGNGFLGMRAARSVSRGPTWVGWLGYSRWASWPRCYVAGLFDVPNTVPPVPALIPVADWSRVRILLDGEPLQARRRSAHRHPDARHALSAGMHALVAAHMGDPEMALRYLRETAATDLDLDPNSAGGVRIAGLGALWQAVMFGFAGLDLRGDMLGIDPRLPAQWRSLSFTVCWRGRSVGIRIAERTVQATLVQGQPMEMRITDVTRKLTAGATVQVSR